MKQVFFILLMITTVALDPVLGNSIMPKGTTIEGTLRGEGFETIKIFQWQGSSFQEVASTKLVQKDGVNIFSFKSLKIAGGLYFFGPTNSKWKPIFLGENEKIKIDGSLDSIPQIKIINSRSTESYYSIMGEMQGLQKSFNSLIQQMRLAGLDSVKMNSLSPKFAALDEKRITLLEKAKAANQSIGNVVSLSTYLSFQNNNNERYKDEAHYFAGEFFKHADLTDASFDNLPQVVDAGKSYAYTTVRAGLTPQEQVTFVNQILKSIPENTARHQSFLLGVTYGFLSAKADAGITEFGDKYVAIYGKDDDAAAKTLIAKISKLKATMIGQVAPEITQPTPDGEVLNLSSFRGKHVLLDFWASWCGPCRRENPNVVRLYNKYKEKGFEVFAVSLDNDKNRWVQAIEKDHLTWVHVSDLKKWQSSVAKEYGVSGIPFTLLLDEEGKIIAKNLRGPNLEAKLKQIFGE